MDKQLVREFRNRWRAVATVEMEEQRATSVALRWQQLNAILGMAIGLGLPLEESKDVEIVRQRWTELKASPR